MAAKHNAGLQIVQLPNGITVNDLRSFIKEFEVQSGKKIDAILVDYLEGLLFRVLILRYGINTVEFYQI